MALLAVLCVVPFLAAIPGEYVSDDHPLVARHQAVQAPFSIVELVMTPYWPDHPTAKLWRPLTTLSFGVDRALSGGAPWLHHAVNVGLHLAVTLLWVAFVRRLTHDEPLALVTGALFAVHPIHSEAVAWISGRAELLAAAFGVLTLLLLTSDGRRRWLAPIAMFLAICSKESVVLLPVFGAYLLWAMPRFRRREASAALAACAGAAVVYVALRWSILGVWTGPAPQIVDQPLVGLSFVDRLPTGLDLLGRYVWLFIWPARLSLDYSPPILTVVDGVTPFAVLGAGALAGMLFLAWRRPAAPAGWGAAFALCTFVLAPNLLVVIGTIFAERLTYLPSAGLLVIVAAAGVALARRGPVLARAAFVALFAVVTLAAARTIDRSWDYRNGLTLAAAEVATHPEGWKMQGNLAHELERRERYEEALVHSAASFELNPRERNVRLMHARLLHATGREDEAIEFLRTLSRMDREDPAVVRALSDALLEAGRTAEADSVVLAAHERFGDAAWTFEAARALHRRGDWTRAAELYGRAADRYAEAPLLRAFCLLRAERIPAARDAYAEALRRDPESGAAANGLAWCTLEAGGSVDEVVRLAELAVQLEASPYHYDTLARAYARAGRCDDARAAARAAVELSGDGPAFDEVVALAASCE